MDVNQTTNSVLTVYESPKFEGIKSIFYFFLSLFLVGTSIYLMVYSQPAFFIFPLFLVPATVMLMLDIHGIEYDPTNKKIRHYSRFFRAKSGEWKDVKSYCFLLLDIKVLHVRRSDERQLFKEFDSTVFYNVILVSNYDIDKDIVIKDFQDYRKAVVFLKKCAKIFNLQTRDMVALRQAHNNIRGKSEYV